MIAISVGSEYDHESKGRVTVENMTEELSEAYVTETDDGPVFDGASVIKTTVHFTDGSENTHMEPFLEFYNNIDIND